MGRSAEPRTGRLESADLKTYRVIRHQGRSEKVIGGQISELWRKMAVFSVVFIAENS
jgi:hypothetical protein